MSPRLLKTAMALGLCLLSVGLYGAHRFQDEPAAIGRAEAALQPRAVPAAGRARQAMLEKAIGRLEERLAHYPDDYEASLFKGLLYFKSGRINQALDELDALTRRAPKFHLAHLVQGDLLLSQTHTVSDIGATPLLAELPVPPDDSLGKLREEAEARLRAYLDTLPGERLPRALLKLGDSVETAIVVDKASHRLYVYRSDAQAAMPELVRDFYVSTGRLQGNKSLRGDLRTPEGVYFITRHIPDSELPDKYGWGAFPMNYPNELDRHLGKTGDGIWLHGTENAFYSRPPLDSEGCVVLPNIDLDKVAHYIRPGVTPVIVTDRVTWVEPEQWQALQREVAAAIEAWRRDWESGDVERYLGHYDEAFWGGGYDIASWRERKRRVAEGKSFQRIEIEDLSLFAYPKAAGNGRELVVANFDQRYRSNNFSSDMPKRLYLAREADGWRVLYEGRQ